MNCRSKGAALGAALALALCSCTHAPGRLASDLDEQDGRRFLAKPEMARLYVVQGLEKLTDQSGTTIATGPNGSPMMVGAAAGLAIAALIQSVRDKPDAPVLPPDPVDPDNKYPHAPIPIPDDVFVNGKNVGTIGHLQYVAIDLPPADYDIKLVMSTTWHQPFASYKVSLTAGQVAYLLTTELAYGGTQKNERAIVSCKPEDCQNFIKAGHRAVAQQN